MITGGDSTGACEGASAGVGAPAGGDTMGALGTGSPITDVDVETGSTTGSISGNQR